MLLTALAALFGPAACSCPQHEETWVLRKGGIFIDVGLCQKHSPLILPWYTLLVYSVYVSIFLFMFKTIRGLGLGCLKDWNSVKPAAESCHSLDDASLYPGPTEKSVIRGPTGPSPNILGLGSQCFFLPPLPDKGCSSLNVALWALWRVHAKERRVSAVPSYLGELGCDGERRLSAARY